MNSSPLAKKVLIIEDEGDMCLPLNIILQDEDHTVDHVKNLHAAAAYLQTQNFRLALS